MKSASVTRRLALATPAIVALGVGGQLSFVELAGGLDPTPSSNKPVEIRLLGVNDLHGHLEPPGAAAGEPAPVGGAATLASHLDRATSQAPGETIRVHAGDMVGASPMISSYFHDEPSVYAMNDMRFDVGTLGNHEFDEGALETMRLIRGGRRTGPGALKHDAEGQAVNTSDPGYKGAGFQYIAANTRNRDGRLLLPPWKILERGGVKVGFIGVTTTSTPTFMLARHSAGLHFGDISDTVNHYVPELTERGVQAIVVLAHSGATSAEDPGKPAGEIVDEVRQMSSEVDVVIAGHTHNKINARIPNAGGDGDKVVVEAKSFGTAYDLVDLRIDGGTGEVISKQAEVPPTPRDQVIPQREINALVQSYARRIAPLAKRRLGTAAHRLVRVPEPGAGKRNLGVLAAEAQRRLADADIGFVNPGNLRDDLEAGPISYEEVFEVNAFEHPVLRMTMTGAAVRKVLAEQAQPEGAVRLYVSGLRGRKLRDRATYTVAANELLATGGRFPALRDLGRDKRRVGTDLEALVRLIENARGPLG